MRGTEGQRNAKDLRISCVVPCLNAESYLSSALVSLLAVAGTHDEIIAVYDHSFDGTLNLLEKFGPRVKIIIRDSSAPRGAAPAINDGFAEATGDILCWLGADDYVFPWAFNVVRAVFAKFEEVRWLTSTQPCVMRGEFVTCEPLQGISHDYFLDGFTMPGRRGARWLQQESTFWRRELWTAAGGALSEDLKCAFDQHLWARFFALAPVCGVDSLLAAFRYRDGQLSSQIEKLLPETTKVLEDARRKSGWRRSAVRESLYIAGWKQPALVKRLALRVAPYCWPVARFSHGADPGLRLESKCFWLY